MACSLRVARPWAVAVAFGLVGWPASAAADEWWGADKALHFGVSAGLAGAGYGASALAFDEPWARAVAGGSVALTAGAVKELADLAGAGEPSWKDMTWNLVGTVVGVGIALAIDLAVRPRDATTSSSVGVVRF